VVVTGSADQLARLDVQLWTFEPGEFIPHARLRAGAGLPPPLVRTPIWLADDAADLPAEVAHAGVLVNLGPEPAAGFDRFPRLIEIVAQAADEVASGRLRWRHYLAAGPPSPRAVPTLTEVVQPPARAPALALDQAHIVEQVLTRLQHQIEPLLAAQVQAAMAPAMAQVLERLLHETRLAMARTLREQLALQVTDAVAAAVADALSRAGPEVGPQRGTGLAG
jgi:DNA polymerase-3 subunit chi